MVSSEASTAPRACAVSAPSRALVPSLPDADATLKRWIWSLPSSRSACASAEIRLRFSGRKKLWLVSMKSTPSWYVVYRCFVVIWYVIWKLLLTNGLSSFFYPLYHHFSIPFLVLLFAGRNHEALEHPRPDEHGRSLGRVCRSRRLCFVFNLCEALIRKFMLLKLEVATIVCRLSMFPRRCAMRNCRSASLSWHRLLVYSNNAELDALAQCLVTFSIQLGGTVWFSMFPRVCAVACHCHNTIHIRLDVLAHYMVA